MNESSLSQQLKDRLKETEECCSMEDMVFIRGLLPAFLTEHEALRRKADASDRVIEAANNVRVYDAVGCFNLQGFSELAQALCEYREATKPSDV